MDKDLALLHQKLDHLTEQLEAQRRRQDEISELMRDVIPVANHMIKLSIDELAEIGSDFELKDLLFLVKRVLRDTRMLVGLLDQLEAVAELADEGQKMGKRIFHQVTIELDRLEREGYFDIARAGWSVVDRLVHEFDAAEVQALGDRMITAVKTDVPEKVSLFALVRAMSDPQTRRGLARTLNLLKALGE